MASATSPRTNDHEHASSHRPGHGRSDDEEILRQLNACVDGMRDHISDEPYVLTIPQDEPKFHHYSRYAADAWLLDSPFERNENYQVQYQSFFYREPYTDLFERVRYSHFDRSTQTNFASNSIQPRSLTSTPTVGPKKKISLAAYKNKQAQGATTTPSERKAQAPVHQKDKEQESKKASTSSLQTKVERAPAISSHVPEETSVKEELKRNHTRPALPGDAVSPPKKQRLDYLPPPSLASPASKQKSRVSRDARDAKDAPERSSDFDRLSPLNHLYLPGRLSPTLPPELVAALDQGNHKRSTSHTSVDPNTQPKTVSRRPGSKHDSILSHTNEPPAEDALARPSHKDAAIRAIDDRPSLTKPQRQIPDPPHPSRSIAKPLAQHDSSKIKAEHKEEPSKGVAKKTAPSKPVAKAHAPSLTPASTTKRPHATDDNDSQPQPKRKKLPPMLKAEKDPSTPLQPDFRSPALPQSAIKSQQATPTANRQHLRTSVAMKRVESTDSLANITPARQDRTPLPKPSQLSQQTSTKPSPSGAAKTAESQAWSTEYTRLNAISKELKRAAQAPSEDASKSELVAEIAALVSLESFLAFVLTFYCYDKSITCRNPPLVPTPQMWQSCTAFWNSIMAMCQSYPHLSGLLGYLGVVYNGVILRRLATGNKHDPKLLQETLTAAAAAMKAADEASHKLPLSTLKSDYPQTWKRGTTAQRVEEHVTPGHYDGGFSLNIGIHTDPLEAVRFGHALLSEWGAKKELDYKMRLKLSPA
ncbi:hypothetical protein BDV97DRAFT_346962 [Delphinella strobiligena]|nr:hypothetical protein BDV97DRAFT_346962 [Delphinella strobiligena]